MFYFFLKWVRDNSIIQLIVGAFLIQSFLSVNSFLINTEFAILIGYFVNYSGLRPWRNKPNVTASSRAIADAAITFS